MLIVWTGDWQCSLQNLDRCQIIVNQLVEILRSSSETYKYVIHLGDIKENFNPIDQRVTNFTTNAIQKLKEHCGNVFFVRGNHDSITTQDGVPSIIPVIQAAGAIVADQNWTRGVFGGERDGVALWMVPFLRNPEAQKEQFKLAVEDAKNYKLKVKKILAFHNEIEGCQRSAYTKGQGLTLDDIGAAFYDQCVSGHIHGAQLVASNVRYAGSPFCQDWSECNQKKSHLVFEIGEKIKIFRVASLVPGWFDFSVPGFEPPKNWKGCHLRHTVSIYKDPNRELKEARKLLEDKYPGVILNLIPDFQKNVPVTEAIDIKGTDEEILTSYLSKATLPPETTVDQVLTYLHQYLPHIGLFGVQGLRFKSFVGKNVLGYENVVLDLDKKGLTLITGVNLDWGDGTVSNGAGKSSLATLTFIPLFGKTFKNQKADEWARQNSKDPCIASLVTQLPNGHEFKVIRGRRPGALRVYEDGNEITMGDVNQTQALIESRTNLTWEVLTNSVYIGQREIGSVFGTEKDRKELFSRLLGLDRFLEAQEKIRKNAIRVQRCLDDTDDEIESVKRALQEADLGVAGIQSALDETPVVLDKDIKSNKIEISELEFKIRCNNKLIEDFQPRLEENQKEFEKFLFAGIEADTKSGEIQKQIGVAEGLTGKPTCPACNSKVSVKALEDYVIMLRKSRGKYQTVAGDWETRQEQNRTFRKTLLEKVQACNFENRKAEARLKELRKEESDLSAHADARARLEKLLAGKSERKREQEHILQIHERALEAYRDEMRFLEFCSFTVGRNGLPAHLCAITVPHLNQAAAKYSRIFADGEIGIQFSACNGDIDIEVINIHGGKQVKDQSEGEMCTAARIAAFAFREVLVPHNLLILDEPTQGLDSVNSSLFAKGLNEVKDRFEHIIIISHNAHLLAALEPDFRIEVVKQNGISTAREI